jgi:hypothetical protein
MRRNFPGFVQICVWYLSGIFHQVTHYQTITLGLGMLNVADGVDPDGMRQLPRLLGSTLPPLPA